jgi:hypothetical protein
MHFDNTASPTQAATFSQFAALQYLIEAVHCPWDLQRVRSGLLRSRSGQQLQWLRATGTEAWTVPVLSDMLITAALNSNIAAAAEWLVAQGALWPDSFLHTTGSVYGQRTCWPAVMMQWALGHRAPAAPCLVATTIWWRVNHACETPFCGPTLLAAPVTASCITLQRGLLREGALMTTALAAASSAMARAVTVIAGTHSCASCSTQLLVSLS